MGRLVHRVVSISPRADLERILTSGLGIRRRTWAVWSSTSRRRESLGPDSPKRRQHMLTLDMKAFHPGCLVSPVGCPVPARGAGPLAVILGTLERFSYLFPSFDTDPCKYYQQCYVSERAKSWDIIRIHRCSLQTGQLRKGHGIWTRLVNNATIGAEFATTSTSTIVSKSLYTSHGTSWQRSLASGAVARMEALDGPACPTTHLITD